MDLSVGFVLGSLLFLTPALVLVVALRIYYPINRTLAFLKQGLVMPAIALLISAVINGPLFLDYATWWLKEASSSLPKAADRHLVEMAVWLPPGWVHRPGTWLLKHVVGLDLGSHHVLGLVADVHTRVLAVSIGLIVLVRLVTEIGQYVEAQWYVRKSQRSDASRFITEKADRQWYNPLRFVQYVREAIYHPWALLTSYNRYREALMVDVLCRGDNLYSGMFSSWMPQGDEAASTISLQYILRHHARDPVEGDHPATSGSEYVWSPPLPSAGGGNAGDARPQRRVTFIERDGEMVFPWGELTNIHFWELRRGLQTIVTVKHGSDVELAKWWLALNEVNPGKIANLVINFEDDGSSKAQLLAWAEERKLSLNNVVQTVP